MSIFAGQQEIMFADQKHFDFYEKKTTELKPDCYLKALIYAVGMCAETRRNFEKIYNQKERCIVPEIINAGWQTGDSVKVTRLALQLFTDSTPTIYSYDEKGNKTAADIKECQLYSVSDIFCCGYAPYFVEAVKIRYPEYFKPRNVYNDTKRRLEQIAEKKAD